MTTTAHEDQFTDAPEPVRQPYDTGSILRRNVADLEVALRKQTKRAEKAEAELAKLREQELVAMISKNDAGQISIKNPDGSFFDISKNVGCQFYAAPVTAPAVPDANPVQWLADEGDMILVPRGLLGAACSSIDKQRPAPKVLEALRYYTMNAPQAPAVPDAKTAGIIKRLRDACPAGSGCKCTVNDAASELERLSALLQSTGENHDQR